MGPTIILDKSALQSISQAAVRELTRYFYTVIPPILLMEILADVALDVNDIDTSRQRVAQLARKLLPPGSFSNIPFRWLCTCELLGTTIPMNRTPVVSGGQPVTTASGERGLYVGVQPENEALLRWRYGEFNEDDMTSAISWRSTTTNYNLEAIKQGLPRLPLSIKSLEELREYVDGVLSIPEAQLYLLNWYLDCLGAEDYIRKWTLHRWRVNDYAHIRDFAPYSFHCIRVHKMFYIGMGCGLIGTKSTNVVDIDYLCYSPFAHVFCSYDNIHRSLAPLVCSDDQSFVWGEDFRNALSAVAQSRQLDGHAEPADDSLIRELWVKHLGGFAPQAAAASISEERSKEIWDKMQPIIDAIHSSEAKRPPSQRWPK